MENSARLLKELLSPEIARSREFLWQDIVAALEDVAARRTPESEAILVDLLRFEGPIRLAPDSALPSAMPPEDALKFLAMRYLSEWTGAKYLKEFRYVRSTAKSSVLRGMAGTQIARLGGEAEGRGQ